MLWIRWSRLKKHWLFAHRWIGLFAGFHFLLLGLSGSALVFFKELDRWIAGDRYSSQASGMPMSSLDQMAGTLEAATQLIYVLPGKMNSTIEFWTRPAPGSESRVACNFDRGSGTLLKCWSWGETVMSWIYDFHHELLLGSVGAKIVGITGLLTLFLIVTGLVLWWPRSKFQWKTAFRFLKSKSQLRMIFDFHRLVGVYSSLALFLVSFSGVALTFPESMKSVVSVVSKTSEHPTFTLPRANIKNSFDLVLKTVLASHPGSELVYMVAPAESHQPYEVGIQTPSDLKVRGVLTEIWVDPVEQKILEVRPFEKLSLGDKFMVLQFPIHNGDLFGLVGRLLVVVLGLVPCLLFGTGLAMYLRKRRRTVAH